MEKSRAIELLEHLAWDRDIDRNPYGDALNMAIDALKAQLSQEGTTSDTISRQWLLDCINDGWIKFDTDKDTNRFIHLVRDIAPTIQPEERTEKRMETHACDLISRQQAIDALDCISGVEEVLRSLPPVQPEPSIPLSWIEGHIEWLKNLDNEFANLAAAHISVMVKKWRDEQGEQH